MTVNAWPLPRIASALSIPFRDAGPPADRFVAANGIRFHYLDWGGTGKPVLFLHGGAQTAHTWDLVCLALRDDYRCLALDLRGHGGSEGLFRFGVERPREDLAAVADALAPGNFALVGMSLGGMDALAYAGRHASRLAAVAFVDASPEVSPQGYRDNAAIGEAVRQARDFDAAADSAYRLNPRGSPDYKRYVLGQAIEPVPGGGWRLASEARREPAGDPAAHKAMMAERRERLWQEASRVACPALIVHGAESRAQSAGSLQRFCDALPDARLATIAGASHYVQEDEPAALAEAIRRFLRDIGY